LLPFELHEALARLPSIVARLRRTEARDRRTQRERFRRRAFKPWGAVTDSC
jgi:hypothetical protein